MTTIPTLAALLTTTPTQPLRAFHLELAGDHWDALVAPLYENKISAREAVDAVMQMYPTSGIKDFAAFATFHVNDQLRKQLEAPLKPEQGFHLNHYAETECETRLDNGMRLKSVLQLNADGYNGFLWEVRLMTVDPGQTYTPENNRQILRVHQSAADLANNNVGTLQLDVERLHLAAAPLLTLLNKLTPYMRLAPQHALLDALSKQLTTHLYSHI